MNAVVRIFDIVSGPLAAAGIDCVLIGGFAVNHYGYSRSTMDVDFMVATDELDRVRRILVDHGFSNVTTTDNAVFFCRPDSALRVDFLRVDGDTMGRIRARGVRSPIGGREIIVPALRDLIAMKLFAAEHAGERRWDKDLGDVAHLCRIHRLVLDADIRPLCATYASDRVFSAVASRVRAIESC